MRPPLLSNVKTYELLLNDALNKNKWGDLLISLFVKVTHI